MFCQCAISRIQSLTNVNEERLSNLRRVKVNASSMSAILTSIDGPRSWEEAGKG